MWTERGELMKVFEDREEGFSRSQPSSNLAGAFELYI